MKKRASEIYACIPVVLITALFCFGIAAACMQNASAQGTQFSSDQLVSIVAPVALYPDDLLTNVLTASTIPDQVSQAAQYVKNNGGKVSSMPDTDWDPSVKALLYFPDVLYKMNGDMNWTQNLGNAVINQMDDVLTAVQSFRSTAYNAGNLQSNEQQKVVTEQSNIIIESSNPDVIYVPSYDPVEVVNTGHPVAAFATGVAVSNWWRYNNVNWNNRNIAVNPAYISHYNYRPGGYYYNNLVPRPGYAASNVWNPAVRAGYGNVNRVGAGNVNRVGAGNVNRVGATDVNRVGGGNVRAGNTVNINTGGNTVNRANTNTANRVSTSDLNSRLQQGLKNTGGNIAGGNRGNVGGAGSRANVGGAGSPQISRPQVNQGGAFGGMNSGSGARAQSQRGSMSRSSSSSSGSFNRGGGGGSMNRGGGGGGRRR
ncbi:MAG: DUF3300 domain-containing protein [Vulcanimicrobiota bacterium]